MLRSSVSFATRTKSIASLHRVAIKFAVLIVAATSKHAQFVMSSALSFASSGPSSGKLCSNITNHRLNLTGLFRTLIVLAVAKRHLFESCFIETSLYFL